MRLEGTSARLDFDGWRCIISYPLSTRRSLLRALDSRPVPVAALADAVLRLPAGRARRGELLLVPRPGADPVADVLRAAQQRLPDMSNPYLIRFRRTEVDQAKQLYAGLSQAIRTAPAPPGRTPLVPVPPPPPVLRAVSCTVECDGSTLRLAGGPHHGADGAPRIIPLAALEGVTYVHSTRYGPTLRLRLPGAAAPHPSPFEDPNTLVLKPFDEAANVLFAAAVLRGCEVSAEPTASVRTEESADDGTTFAASALLADGREAGAIRVRTPGPDMSVREIELLQVDGFPDPRLRPAAADALLRAALRWAYASGADFLTGRPDADAAQRELYRRHGFSTTSAAYLSETVGEAPRPSLALGTYTARRDTHVLDALDDVSPRRRRAAGCGSWALGAVLFYGLIVLASTSQLADGPSLLGVPLGFAAVAVPIVLFAWPRMRSAVRASELRYVQGARGVLTQDPRPPVLYLRSFRDDKRARAPSRPGSLVTEEEAVATAMAGIGPFIALDRDIEVLGAAKGRVADTDWRPAVTTLMEHCRLTVLRCGEGASLYWELGQAVTLLDPHQLVILVPSDHRLYETFRERAAEIMPHPLPAVPMPPRRARPRLVAAIRFSPDWRPQVVSLRLPPTLRFLSVETCLAFRLLPQLTEFSPNRSLFWVRRVFQFCVLAAAVFFLVGTGPLLLDGFEHLTGNGDGGPPSPFPSFPDASPPP
ncbi:DUF4429 domain-containing protein [Streptomyces sp. 8N114]|uniref:DUF4429 domain-containing protein n=1 Tax=Streptomyces sp. 8N114 TaxID=3457419 RepID=UPI003FD01220